MRSGACCLLAALASLALLTHLILVPHLDDLAVRRNDAAAVLVLPSAAEPVDAPHALAVSLVLDRERARRPEIVQKRVTRARSDGDAESVGGVALEAGDAEPRAGRVEGVVVALGGQERRSGEIKAGEGGT